MGYHVIVAIPITWNNSPDDWADQLIAAWMNSEAGKWAKEHSRQEMLIDTILEIDTITRMFRVRADFTDEDMTYWKLKYL
jgi:hypothetical protein